LTDKFEKYQSPANKQIRITSAVGKRITSSRQRQSASNLPINDYEGETIKESAERQAKALVSISKSVQKGASRSSVKLNGPLKHSRDEAGKSRIVDTETTLVEAALKISENQHLSIAPRSGAMTSFNIPTSMGGKRRVHQDGLKMLDNHYEM